jgi:copper oxidase (laccase) domain-containing protein
MLVASPVMTFLNAGAPRENIQISDICSCCNPDLIFSHRYTKGQRGVSAAFLGIK